MRSAVDSAPLAFLSSRVAARPMVNHLFGIMSAHGLARAERLLNFYDERTNKCMRELTKNYPPERYRAIESTLIDGCRRAERAWFQSTRPRGGGGRGPLCPRPARPPEKYAPRR